ncbi:MAG: hypothetical protein P4L46_16490 [Fimbriimonas sp.]|nr:hypothetical protein [Fimbriimonas sp.]
MFEDEVVPGIVESKFRASLWHPRDIQIVAFGEESGVKSEDPASELKASFALGEPLLRGVRDDFQVEWTNKPYLLAGFHRAIPCPRSQYSRTSYWSVRRTTANSSPTFAFVLAEDDCTESTPFRGVASIQTRTPGFTDPAARRSPARRKNKE